MQKYVARSFDTSDSELYRYTRGQVHHETDKLVGCCLHIHVCKSITIQGKRHIKNTGLMQYGHIFDTPCHDTVCLVICCGKELYE